MLATLRVLSKGDFQSEAADIHGISQPSFSRMFMGVVDALNASLDNIIFPMGQEEILRTKEDFLRVANFPNVVGAIDGTLIPIIGMSGDDEHVFVCRKGFHAINMQGIVTADCKLEHSRDNGPAARWRMAFRGQWLPPSSMANDSFPHAPSRTTGEVQCQSHQDKKLR